MDLCRRHPVASYVVLACVLSWAAWLPFVVYGDRVRPGDPWPTHLLGLLGPAAAALVVTAFADGRAGLRRLAGRLLRWPAKPGWYALCALTIALGLAVAAVVRGIDWSDAATFNGTADLGIGLTFVLILVVNGFGEETGWRGFLVDRLLTRHSLFTTSLLVAVAWGVWHLPLFFLLDSFRGMGVAVVGWALGLLCGSVVLTWLYARSGRSIPVVALWHTSFNFASGTVLMDGAPAAVTSTVVILAAVLLARRPEHRRAPPRTSRDGAQKSVRGGT